MAEIRQKDRESELAPRALTWKSLTLGILLVLAAAIAGFYARHVLRRAAAGFLRQGQRLHGFLKVCLVGCQFHGLYGLFHCSGG
jgi:hypothetical protein